jgi:pimeloyl-ACP methyl ester carboxylesterase
MTWGLVLKIAGGVLASGGAARLLGIYLSHRYAKRYPTSKSYAQLDPERKTDAVIFVHGLHGHFRDTWPKMPELVHSDPNLPHVDVYLWGYRASVFPGISRLPTVGKALMTFAREKTGPNDDLFFVGHSMGGLVILDGLTAEARENRANVRPAAATRRVILYASPLAGSSAASAIRATVGLVRYAAYFVVNGHLRELSRGKYCDNLLNEVVNRIYNPTIKDGDKNSKVRIPLKAVVGGRDPVVEESSATFCLQDPAPSTLLNDDHFTVKQPEDHGDPRYRALYEQLAEHYSVWFRERSRAAIGGDVVAGSEIYRRCKYAAVWRLKLRPTKTRASDAPERIEELISGAMKLAVLDLPRPLNFESAFNTALDVMVKAGK